VGLVVFRGVYGANNLRGMFGLCIFGSPYSLDGRGFAGFNVD